MFLTQQQKNTLVRELDKIEEIADGWCDTTEITMAVDKIKKMLISQPNVPVAEPE